jgi:acetylglutamate kinase
MHAAMHRFANRTFVLRLDEAAPDANGATVVGDLTFLAEHGVHPIVVAPTRAVARNYVRAMNRTASAAVGLSGCDAAMLPAGGAQGIGAVQTGILRTLLAAGYLPVIEPTALGIGGDDVDVAADDVAAAVAAATEAARAIFFHAAGGVVDPQTAALIDELTPAEALALAERADLDAGLRAAVRAAALGVRAGVAAAQIIDGRIAHAAVIEFLTAQHLGTQVTGGVYLGGA